MKNLRFSSVCFLFCTHGLIATVNGKFYRSSPISLPEVLAPYSDLLKELAQTRESIRGNNLVTDEKVGDILYKAERSLLRDK